MSLSGNEKKMEREIPAKRKPARIANPRDMQLFEALHKTMLALPLLATNSTAYLKKRREFEKLKKRYLKRKSQDPAEMFKAEEEFRKQLRRKVAGDLNELAQRTSSFGSGAITVGKVSIMPTTAISIPIGERIRRTMEDIERRDKIERRKKARAEKFKRMAEKAKEIVARLRMQRKPK